MELTDEERALIETIREAVSFEEGGESGYTQSAEALWKAAYAAFMYVAEKAGVTSFQAQWAVMKFVSEANSINGPFALIRAENMLYPQYHILRDVELYIEEWKPWAAKEAKRLLNKKRNYPVSPTVWQRWTNLAALDKEDSSNG